MVGEPTIITDRPAAFNKSWKRIRKMLIPIVLSDEPINIIRMDFKEERSANEMCRFTIELEFLETTTRIARL